MKRRSFSLFAALVCLSVALHSFGGNVYLAPGGTGAGSSWSDACGTLVAAYSAVGAGETIFVAKGEYDFTSTLTITKSVTIEGGYDPATGERDLDANMTLFGGGEVSKSTRTWIRCTPDSANYTLVTEDTGIRIYDPATGELTIPEPTGDYETFYPSSAPMNAGRVILVNSASAQVVIDGITFTGGSNTAAANGMTVECTNGALTIRDCRFIGCFCYSGVLVGGMTVEDCDFIYSRTTTGSIFQCVNSAATKLSIFRNCRIIGASAVGELGQLGFIFNVPGGSVPCVIENCVITRAVADFKENSARALILATAAANAKTVDFTGNVISNCTAIGTGAYGAPLFISSRRGLSIQNTHFANNKCVVKPVSGWVYSIFAHSTAYTSPPAFDRQRFVFDSCTFTGNTIEAPDTSEAPAGFTSCLLGARSHVLYVVNCTFAENGVVPIAMGLPQPGTCALGVANCTFIGESIAAVEAMTAPPNVVNCLFTADFPKDCNLIDCSKISASSLGDFENCVPPIRRLQTWLPEVREGADISWTANLNFREYNFRKRGETTWRNLASPSIAGSAGSVALVDALGEERPLGGSTRGAVQLFSEAAENGVSLVAIAEPEGAGTFSSAAQIVAANAPASVTAIADSAAEFVGWFDAALSPLGNDETLALSAVAENTAVYARFETASVPLTFVCGDAAPIVVNAAALTPMSEVTSALEVSVPAGKRFAAWEALPALVPRSSETYTARLVDDGAIFYVAPLSRGAADGTSPENATCDINFAAEKAAEAHGEVRFEPGVYTLGETIIARSNVILRGSSEGGTIICGDILKDDNWKNKAGQNVGAVWNWNTVPPTFNEPDFQANEYCSPSLNASEDAGCAIKSSAAIDNFRVENITFTGFISEVIDISGNGGNAAIENCRFLANQTATYSENNGLDARYEKWTIVAKNLAVSIDNCVFIGNSSPLRINSAADFSSGTNVIANCVFRKNFSDVRQVYAIFFEGACNVICENCDFTENAYWEQYSRAWIRFSTTGSVREMRACNFTRNKLYEAASGLVTFLTRAPTLTNCNFVSNSFVTVHTGSGSGASALCISGTANDSPPLRAENCFFANNVVTNTSTSSGTIPFATIFLGSRFGRATFVNCTFLENESIQTKAGRRGGMFVLTDRDTEFSLVNCTVANSVIAGEATQAEILCGGLYVSGLMGIFNTVVVNDDPAYVFLNNKTISSANPSDLSIVNSVLPESFDLAEFPVRANSVCIRENIFLDSTPGLSKAPTRDATGEVCALGLSSASPYRRAGIPLWRGSDGYTYFINSANAATPLWRIDGLVKVAENSAASKGIDLGGAPIADAFGRARKLGAMPLGPLNTANGGTRLLVK